MISEIICPERDDRLAESIPQVTTAVILEVISQIYWFPDIVARDIQDCRVRTPSDSLGRIENPVRPSYLESLYRAVHYKPAFAAIEADFQFTAVEQLH